MPTHSQEDVEFGELEIRYEQDYFLTDESFDHAFGIEKVTGMDFDSDPVITFFDEDGAEVSIDTLTADKVNEAKEIVYKHFVKDVPMSELERGYDRDE